jgi:hypothetical protein
MEAINIKQDISSTTKLWLIFSNDDREFFLWVHKGTENLRKFWHSNNAYVFLPYRTCHHSYKSQYRVPG